MPELPETDEGFPFLDYRKQLPVLRQVHHARDRGDGQLGDGMPRRRSRTVQRSLGQLMAKQPHSIMSSRGFLIETAPFVDNFYKKCQTLFIQGPVLRDLHAPL